MHLIGGLILLAAAVIVFGSMLGRETARTWDARWPGTRPSRRQAMDWAVPRARSAASYGRARWTRSRPAGWLPARVRGIVLTEPGPGHDDGQAPQAAAPSRPGPAPRQSPTTVQGTVVATAAPPATAAPAPAADQQPPTGRTTEVTTPAVTAGTPALLVPGAEEMATGMARLRQWAVNGNAEQKEAAFRALSEVWSQDAATVRALAQSMAEDSRYSVRVIEAVEAMAPVLTALSMRAGEAEGKIAGVLNSTGRDLIASGEAPERRELMAEPGAV